MPDILHHFCIEASPDKIFEAISTVKGLNAWWPKACKIPHGPNGIYEFDFGPGYYWLGKVTKLAQDAAISWEMTEADGDWTGTKVGFQLIEKGEKGTVVEFFHTGWKDANEHFRRSSYCWAMYLRLLKGYVETEEIVPYSQRLFV
ncbi:MAG: SRPBCC domain-containing protein [Bacteroidota bacterium]